MFADYNIIKKTSPLAFSLGEGGGIAERIATKTRRKKEYLFLTLVPLCLCGKLFFGEAAVKNKADACRL